jgi:hypothetical protein
MSKPKIALFILAIIAASPITVEATYFILEHFVIHNPNDPLTNAGGMACRCFRKELRRNFSLGDADGFSP